MKNSIGAFLAVIATAGFLAGCNNNNNSNPPGTGTNCNGPVNQMEMLYPIPGATNVNPNTFAIYASTSSPLPGNNQFDLALAQSNGTNQISGATPSSPSLNLGFSQVSASQIPTPHAKPTYKNATYYVTYFPFAIGASQFATIYWNDAGTGCTPNVILGTFTTQ